MIEKPSIGELIKVLKKCNKDSEYVIEVLKSIIQTKLMYGGDMQELIDFQIHKAKTEFLKKK